MLTFRGLLLKTLALMCLLSAGLTHASEDAVSLIETLKAQIEALSERIELLEAQQTASSEVKQESVALLQDPKPGTPAKKAWSDSIKLKGDFRYRHEAFDIENRRDRHRQRMRARVALSGSVNDQVSVGFGLATGGSDPISTNQTFDDASSSKNVVIDLAYAKWSPRQGLDIVAGKFKNPIHRAGGNGLLWDGDLNPEGLGFSYESGNFFANGIASWVDESSGDDDSFLVGGQVGVDADAGQGAIKLGLGYFNYLDSRGERAFYDGSAMGNRLNSDGEYVEGFELIEGFAEYSVNAGAGKLSLFADYVHNVAADDFETGWALGGKYRQAKWQFGYTYQELEADAVLGTFSDSDFIGGGTDGEGHILSANYALGKQISLRGTLFLNDRNIDFGNEEEYKRLMLDISFKY